MRWCVNLMVVRDASDLAEVERGQRVLEILNVHRNGWVVIVIVGVGLVVVVVIRAAGIVVVQGCRIHTAVASVKHTKTKEAAGLMLLLLLLLHDYFVQGWLKTGIPSIQL